MIMNCTIRNAAIEVGPAGQLLDYDELVVEVARVPPTSSGV